MRNHVVGLTLEDAGARAVSRTYGKLCPPAMTGVEVSTEATSSVGKDPPPRIFASYTKVCARASMSSTSRSIAYGCVSPLSPRRS